MPAVLGLPRTPGQEGRTEGAEEQGGGLGWAGLAETLLGPARGASEGRISRLLRFLASIDGCGKLWWSLLAGQERIAAEAKVTGCPKGAFFLSKRHLDFLWFFFLRLLGPHQRLEGLHGSFLCPFLGGNSGIGKATAVDLARRGARVVLACRNKARGESAVYDIRRESGNSEVILMILDLGSLKSVRAFAQNFLKSEPRLDILINNAGVFQDGQTSDGFDQAFQVNHLGHFLLTHLLLDRLKRSAPSRIVILSSSSHTFGKIDFRTIHKPVEGMWKALRSYGNSKLANILHARELANRLEGTNITCYAVHPGPVRTELGYSCRWWVVWFLWFVKMFRRDCDAGAQTSIYCATEEGIERLSGQYFMDCHPLEPSSQACDDHLAKKLWEFSERLLGLTT